MKNILIIILSGLPFFAKAQVPDHIPLMTANWDLLETKQYKPNKYGIYFVYFPPPLKARDNKPFELPGYMIPVKAGLMVSDFMLSVLPVLQCQFCGQANVPAMVSVHLSKPVPYTEETILVKGTLLLNGSDDSQPEFGLADAVIIKK